jgi:hypothetical protein
VAVHEELLERAREYELRVESSAELAELGREGQREAAVGFAAVALALRELADVLEREGEAA